MKFPYIYLIAIVSVALLGCANRQETMTESTTDSTQKRVHTQEELKKTGETETGPALQKVDPSIQVSGQR